VRRRGNCTVHFGNPAIVVDVMAQLPGALRMRSVNRRPRYLVTGNGERRVAITQCFAACVSIAECINASSERIAAQRSFTRADRTN